MMPWLRLAATAALLLLAACSPQAGAPLGLETDDPGFIAGQRFNRSGEPQRALAEFKGVIARRGGDNAPESHLEVGLIYLKNLRQPLRAIDHFEEYLRLRPNSTQAAFVADRIGVATREFVKTLPGQAVGNVELLELRDEVARLRKDNERLQNELQSAVMSGLRTAIVPVGSAGESTASIPRIPLVGDPAAADDGISPPPPTVSVAVAPLPAVVPAASSGRGTPAAKAAATTGKTAPVARGGGGRSHTVAADGKGLFAIAKQYYPSVSNATIQSIVDANPSVLTQGANTPLRPGMVLRMP